VRERDHLGDLGVVGTIILKQMFDISVGGDVDCIDVAQDRGRW
jgi:hypothetical protein